MEESMIDKTKNFGRHFILRRRLFLWGEVNDESSLQLIKQMKFLYQKNTDPIYIYINSYGGVVEDGLAIIDEMRGLMELGVEINTVAQGQACSMAAYILACGSYRYATENTTIMLHPVWSDSDEGDNNRLKRSVDFYSRKEEMVIKLVAERCGRLSAAKFKQFKEDIDKSLWMTPLEAKRYGLIDDIYNYEWEKEEKGGQEVEN
jgi:ATP-dependent Clp protease protease subunit